MKSIVLSSIALFIFISCASNISEKSNLKRKISSYDAHSSITEGEVEDLGFVKTNRPYVKKYLFPNDENYNERFGPIPGGDYLILVGEDVVNGRVRVMSFMDTRYIKGFRGAGGHRETYFTLQRKNVWWVNQSDIESRKMSSFAQD